jgi:RimJ/RimL family protein N-acetyltransferase
MLNGKLISLGPVIPADFPALFRWGNDVDSARVNEVYRPSDWNSHQEWWSNIGKDASKVIFAIRKQGSKDIIGYVQIINISGIHQSAHIGVRIGEAADRGHGYGREATSLAIDYCWNHLNLGRISLTVFKTNERALKLYSSAGFEMEGLLRRAMFIDGQWVDVVLMSMLHPSRVNRQQPAAYAAPAEAAAAPPNRTEEPGRPRVPERAAPVAEAPRQTRPYPYPRSPDSPGEPPLDRGDEPRPRVADRPTESPRQNRPPPPYPRLPDGPSEPPMDRGDESRLRATDRPAPIQEAPRRDRGRPSRENPAPPAIPPGRTRPW